MKHFRKRRILILFLLFFPIFILTLSQNIKLSYAQSQYSNGTIIVSSNFSILEYSEDQSLKENQNSVNLTLPSPTWNITHLEINFTSIKMSSEVNEVESEISEDTRFAILNKGTKGYAVQINITEPTTIFSVEIFGEYREVEAEDNLTVEIRGYGDPMGDPDAPNATIYGTPTSLNITDDSNWHVQTFPDPIDLNPGYYYLVINGTSITKPNSQSEYWFYYNDASIENPDLLSYSYDGSWSSYGSGKVFLYKLKQRVDISYTPQEDIDMGILFNGTVYNVSKGLSPYTGNVSIPFNNYSPGSENFNIPVRNNLSIELLLNYSYHLTQKNFLISGGSALIRESVDNQWSITPNIVRTDGNYSIEFEYPITWQNLKVYKGSINITSDPNVTISNNKIFIGNDIITQGASWNITANSPNVNFEANIPTSIYESGQIMKITAIPPPFEGNFTFILVDPFGFEEDREIAENPSGNTLYEYTLPINPFTGQWKAYIIWNNQTDIGLRILSLQVITANGGGGGGGDSTVITGIDPQLIFMTILYLAIGSLAGLSSYKMVKRRKRIKAEHREKVFNKYMDLLNLDYIMIIDKKTGLNVYDQMLAGKQRDTTLISGFLEAIRTFGIDLTGSEEESQTISLQYQNMNIIMNDFKNFRILSIIKESPSKDFLDSLRPLSHDIDTFYGKSLKDFDGDITKFMGIKDLLETHLHTSLIYPLKVVKTKETKLNSAEKSLTNKAQSLMKKNKTDYFYVSHLMGTSKEFNVKNAEIILKLIEKKVFRPIE